MCDFVTFVISKFVNLCSVYWNVCWQTCLKYRPPMIPSNTCPSDSHAIVHYCTVTLTQKKKIYSCYHNMSLHNVILYIQQYYGRTVLYFMIMILYYCMILFELDNLSSLINQASTYTNRNVHYYWDSAASLLKISHYLHNLEQIV